MAFYHELNTHFLPSSSSYDILNRAEPDDDTWHDDCHLLGEKKRRLSIEQVRALEMSFELGNKLDSERKTELARALGLQPRQVAIWFQNRRARWKNKQLENNYDALRRRIESVKSDNDALRTLNKKLHSQLLALKTRESKSINLNKDNGGDETTRSIDTTFYLHPSNENAIVFPSSIASSTPLQCSSRTGHKIDHTPTSNEPLCNMFVGVEDNNPGYWPWPGQQNFH